MKSLNAIDMPLNSRVLVVGSGSVGRRHISNLLSSGVDVLVFSYQGRNLESEFNYRLKMVESWRDCLSQDINGVIVSNSTDQHLDVALEAARRGINIFVEKPLSTSLDNMSELEEIIDNYKLAVECGFMLRLHPNLQWIQQKLQTGDLGEVMHLRAAVGQWLPDWRPGTDHRKGYGAFKAKGGGVIFDLIHELDIVFWLLGPVEDVVAMKRKVDCLEVETEAICQIGLRMASGVIAQVHMDYVRPGYGRNMEIVCRNGVLMWDYVKGVVYLERKGVEPEVVNRTPEGFERNTMFQAHIAHFLKRMNNSNLGAISSFSDAVHVLRIALACHISSDERRNIRPLDL